MTAIREVVRALDRRRAADRSPSMQASVSEGGWVDPMLAGELSDELPLAPTIPAESGAGTKASRDDHKHPRTLGAGLPLAATATGSVGVATLTSREDHRHPAGAYDVRRYTQTYLDAGLAGIAVTHNLGRFPLVQIVESGDGYGDGGFGDGGFGGEFSGLVLLDATIQHTDVNELVVTLVADGNGEVICIA